MTKIKTWDADCFYKSDEEELKIIIEVMHQVAFPPKGLLTHHLELTPTHCRILLDHINFIKRQPSNKSGGADE